MKDKKFKDFLFTYKKIKAKIMQLEYKMSD